MQNRNKKNTSYLVKTIRADERNYWRDFVLMITRSPQQQKKFPLRPKPKKAYTVDADDVHLRSEKAPRHLPEDKALFSQLQSTTLVTDAITPPLFGHSTGRAAKLVGVKIEREHALLGRMLIYDGGTVNRPWDSFNALYAADYHKQKVLDDKIMYSDEQAFERALANKANENKYNEVLARIKWGIGDAIIIGSDTLEARLLARDYARILEERLKRQANEFKYPSRMIDIPIRYYLPNSNKHLKLYDRNQILADIEEAKVIAQNLREIHQKCREKNYEFLLALDKDKLIEVLISPIGNTLILFKLISDGYIHILQSLIELHSNLLNEIKILEKDVDKTDIQILKAPARANQANVLMWLMGLGFGSLAAADSSSPLIIAAEYGSFEAAFALISWSGEIEKLNKLRSSSDQHRVLTAYDVVSALFLASRNGHTDIVRVLLSLPSADPKKLVQYEIIKQNQTIKKLKTSLYTASKHGHADIVALLLQAIAKKNVVEKNDPNSNANNEMIKLIDKNDKKAIAAAITLDTQEVVDAIKIAAKYGHKKVVKKLLPMVSEAIHADILKHSLTYDSIGITDLLFDSYVKLHRKTDMVHRLVLANQMHRDKAASYWAAKVILDPDLMVRFNAQIQMGFHGGVTKEMWKTVAILAPFAKDIDKKDQNGFTALQNVIKAGKVDIAKLLIDKGADYKIETTDGSNLLFLAKDRNTLSFLLDLGLDIHKRNNKQQAMYQVVDENEETMLFDAVKKGDFQFVKYLLSIGSDVNHLNKQGMPALYYAIDANNLEMARLLILNGALFAVTKEHKDQRTQTTITLMAEALVAWGKEFIFNMLSAAFERDAGIDPNDVTKLRTIDHYVESLRSNSTGESVFIEFVMKEHMKQFNALSMKAKAMIFPALDRHGYQDLFDEFAEIAQYDRYHDYMTITDKARYLWNASWERYALPPLVKAELLIDLLESEELKRSGIIRDAKMTLLNDLIFESFVKDRKCKDIVETALENAEAAALLLMSKYGPLLENADRVKIIKKWENSPFRDSFMEAINELPAETKAYGEGISPLAFTLSKTWMFSTDRKMMQEAVLKRATVKSDKYQIGKSFLAFASQLNSWFTKHTMIEADKKLQAIESAYHKQTKGNLELTVNKDEAMMANEISFLMSITELVTQELDKHTTVPHHKIFLGQLLSELDDVMAKGLDKVDQHLSLQ